jgi:hypothetical protein
LLRRFPHINVLGGCCGTDHRHVDCISTACRRAVMRSAGADFSGPRHNGGGPMSNGRRETNADSQAEIQGTPLDRSVLASVPHFCTAFSHRSPAVASPLTAGIPLPPRLPH